MFSELTRTEREKQRRRLSLGNRSRTTLVAAVFLLPTIVALVLLRLQPIVSAAATAFSSADEPFATFAFLFQDPVFLGSLRITLLFSLIINPLQIALAMALAVLLTRHIPMVGLWRTLILLPVAIPQAVSAVIWGVLLRPDGPLNGFLAVFGIPPVPWLTDGRTALASIIIVLSWVGVGYWMTFLVAGIKDIPPSLYEAAEIDGANAWQRFVHITLPGIRRPLLFVLVADTVSNFLIFAPIRILTQGGPQGSTNLLMYNIYEQAYVYGDLPSASAATLVLVLIVLVIVTIQFRLLPGKD